MAEKKKERNDEVVATVIQSEKIGSNTEYSVEEGGTTRKFVKSAEERRLVRKINMATIPFVCAILFTQFIDKSTLNFSAVLNLYEDTGINGSQFSWLGSIFYVGYLAFQLPNQFFLQRVPISKYLGVILLVWGATLACTALARDFSQLAGLRFLLGFFEASTYPSIFLLISTLYRRSEQVLWYGTMFICNSMATAFGGLFGYGIGHMQGVRGLSAWQWCMVIWGAVTTFLGILFFFFLPDKPRSRWFRLTPEEEKIVDERTLDNAVVRNKEIKPEHMMDALKEPRFYCYVLISFLLNLQNGCVTIFSSQIIKNMGFSSLNSILLNIPKGFATILLIGMAMFLSHRFSQICSVGALMAVISLIGALLLVTIPTSPAQLVGIFLAQTSPPYTLLQTCISNNVSGYTKKIFYTGGNMVAYCVGNFVGPLMMVDSQAPRYWGAMLGYIIADLLAVILFIYVRYTLIRDNKKRQELHTAGHVPPAPPNREQLDLTDGEDLHFVYRP